MAVITGGARGFGKAFGAALAGQGALVALVDRDEDAVRNAAAEIGALAIPFLGDVTNEAQINAIVAEVARTHGGIDILLVVCTLAAKPFMVGGGGASIVNIASAAAFQGGGYGNSKLAVIGLTMTFARELASDGIRVNAIAPGVILTDTIRDEMTPATLSRIKAMQFLTEAVKSRI